MIAMHIDKVASASEIGADSKPRFAVYKTTNGYEIILRPIEMQ